MIEATMKTGRLAMLAACAALVLTPCAALATEGGGNSYAVGIETHYSGVMFQDGLHMLAYYAYYDAPDNRDNAGHSNGKLAYFHSKVNTLAVRLSYVWPGVKLFGASVETRAALPVPSIDLSLGVARPAALGPLDRSGVRTSVGDLSFAPLLLGWRAPTVHQVAGIEGFIPIGSYDAKRPVNTGRNYYQVAPFYAVTWLPKQHALLPDTSQFSAKLRYAHNGRNDDTAYRSGDELTLEYSAGVPVSAKMALGVNGFIYQQTSDDRQNGVLVNGDGNRGRVKAIGPYLSYQFTPTISVIAKLQWDYAARNRAEGAKLWLQTKVPL